MAQKTSLTKRLMIDKANNLMVISAAVASFVTVFSLVSAKTLLNQSSYQNKIISAKNIAVKQLKTDIVSVGQLNSAYTSFNSETPNVIGGNPDGTGPNDGSNADIVLDSLPDTYNFPALATSLEKILSTQGVTITDISGTDQEQTESAGTTTSSSTPSPVTMPFSISVSGNYTTMQNVIGQFELSIRPFEINSIDLTGSDNSMTLTLSAQTYFQQAKTFKISSETIQ